MAAKIYTASRIAEGNRLFPAEIHLEDNAIMVKFPGFFSGKSSHIVYQQLEGVNIDTPMIGYSTITFVVGGEEISGHGFTKSEVEEIKKFCLNKMSSKNINYQTQFADTITSRDANTNKKGQLSIADELIKYKDLLDDGAITQQEFDTLKSKLLYN